MFDLRPTELSGSKMFAWICIAAAVLLVIAPRAFAIDQILVTQTAGTTSVSEAGGSDSFTVRLDSQPNSTTTVTVYPDEDINLGSGAGVAVILTFTTANYYIEQTVTVSAVNDSIAEGAHDSQILIQATGADSGYTGFTSWVTVHITDNDSAGVTVDTSGGVSVSEAGGNDTYTVCLDSQPTSDVEITISSDAQTTVSPVSLTFTTGNWDTPQTVTVTAVDDSDAEGLHSSTITHSAASIDPVYSGIAISDVIAAVNDNDSAGVTINDGGGLSVNETGTTSDTYTVVLNTQPTNDVVISVSSDAQTTLSPAALTFTTGNWDTPQTVTVTAVDDSDAEGLHSSTITHSAASIDPVYSGIAISDIIAVVNDNDSAGVTINDGGGLSVNETGTTSDTYTVVLNTQPTNDVVISVSSYAQTTLSPAALTFTTGNWDTPQTVTVTAVDDSDAEGFHSSTITHSVASTDPVYSGIAISDVIAAVNDNDSAGVTINDGGGLSVNETGTTSDTYTVVINTQPTGDVVITVSSDAQTTVSPVSLTFTTGNWDTPQTVTVTAVDDSDAEGFHSSTITHSVASIDPVYSGIAISDVIAAVNDNDSAGVTINDGGGLSVNETGTTSDTYTIVLNTQPTNDVVIAVSSDTQTTVSPLTLTFTAGNWDTPQTVTVTAVDDSDAEGSHNSTITHCATSTDPVYSGIAIDDVTAAVNDNDSAGVAINDGGGLSVNETGTTSDTYTIALNTQPTGDVVITVSSDAQTTVSPLTLTFTTGNWDTPQTVSVTAVDDSDAEGLHSSTITHSVASIDPVYSGIAISDVIAVVSDNDSAGVTINNGGGLSVNETGTTSDTYTVVLNTQPTNDVVIAVSSDTQTTVSPLTLTFTAGNWDTPQTVTVTAVDDLIPEGPHGSTLTHSATSTDPVYSGIAISQITVQVVDNDIAGITVAQLGGSTNVNEAGSTSDTYTIVLDTQPTGDVVITVSPDTETTVSPNTLTFTTSDWDTPQTVTVTAIDDDEAEGNQFSVIMQKASSTDPNYNGYAIESIFVSVTDNDVAGISVTESAGSTLLNEAGSGSDDYTVVLNTQPVGDVTITISHDSQTTVSLSTLTFTTGDWNVPQSVTITAVDDVQAEGTHASTISHTSSSTDPQYSGVAIRSVIASITDDDAIGVTITESGGSTSISETGPSSDTYTVVLNTQPTADVILSISTDSDASVSPTSLTFTSGNWDTPQTVTVTAVDDTDPEGPHTSTLTHSTSSLDPNYGGLSVRSITVQVADNDVTGVTIVESGGSTVVSEAGPTSDTYDIVLNTQPTDTVALTLTPDSQIDLGSGAGTSIILTFSTGNWNIAQTVTVTAIDDTAAEGVRTAIVTHNASSTDPNYNGFSICDLRVQVADNDSPGITLTPSGGSTQVNEMGTTSDTYTVVMNTQPSADVTVSLASDGQTTVSPTSLTFTSGNWSTPQTVTVTAIDDTVAENIHTSTITHTAVSPDPDYSGLAIESLVVTITDDDTVGVTITESGGDTSISETLETSDSYAVVLNTQPSSDVVITVSYDSQTTVSPSTLTFTAANWNTPQTVTVTAVDDLHAEGAHVTTLSHAAVSMDTAYSGVFISFVTVHIADNDIAGVNITQTAGSTSVSEEGPTADTYSVVLNTPPVQADVVVTVSSDGQIDLGSGAGVSIALTFTPDNWNVPQSITVTAIDDANAEGPHSTTITHTSASIDTSYNAIVIPSVVVAITDNDSAGVVITEPDGSTLVNEAGPTSDAYTVVLSIAPTTDVTITVDPDTQTDIGAGPGEAVNLIFTPVNWNISQTVTVTAVDDLAAEGAHTSTITHTASSADPNYNGISIRNVISSVIDDDTAGVVITQTDGTTELEEAGPTSDSYTLHLTIPPTSNVTISLVSDGQTTLSTNLLTFTTANWDVPQIVTVTAVDDQIMEGAYHTGSITHVASSSDPNYNAITIATVIPIIRDNDTAGVVVTQTGSSTDVSEQGTTADTYQLVLSTPPTADVTLTLTPNEQISLGQGAGQAIQLSFTTDNWNTPREITVTAIDDQYAEGRHISEIRHSSASSDSNYNAIAIASVYVVITDNDIAGITLTQTNGATEVSEQGPTGDSYSLVLNTRPTGPVTVTIYPGGQLDAGDGENIAVTRTFTEENWSQPQSVTITAVDDLAAEGPHVALVTHACASTDYAYNGVVISPVIVYITDNDLAGLVITESQNLTEIGEDGLSDSYTLVLTTRPNYPVTVTLTSDDQLTTHIGEDEAVQVVFTAENWNEPQTVTVRAVDDPYAEAVHLGRISHYLSSQDAVYNGYYAQTVTARILDNDAAGVSLLQSGGSTVVCEDGTTDSYQIVLTCQISANVTITVDPEDELDVGAGFGKARNLTFTPANWNEPQTVTVRGLDDNEVNDIRTYRISHLIRSLDGSYTFNNAAGIEVQLLDDGDVDESFCGMIGIPLIGLLGFMPCCLTGFNFTRGDD